MKFKKLSLISILFLINSAIFAILDNSSSKIALDIELEKEQLRGQQDIFAFTKTKIPSQVQRQQRWVINFKKNYFAPWNDPELHFSKKGIYEKENKFIKKFTKTPGWGFNKRPYSTEWAKHLSENMQINYPFNTNKPAITLRNIDLRILPTNHPSFTNWTDPGQGPPFDDLQESHLHINSPIYVLHTSKDKIWSLVITSEKTYGWVKNNDIAFVDQSFIQDWQNNNFITSKKEPVPILHNNVYQGHLKIGSILPILKEEQNNYTVKFASRSANGRAAIKTTNITKDHIKKWPISANAKSVAEISNELNGHPYGWGGLLGERDCSALVKDIFTAFGYWLPRNSSDIHAYVKNNIPIGHLNAQEKEEKIINSATPFFSLLWFKGHIMLYLGHDNKETYSFHAIWGLRTQTTANDKDGRSIFGRALVQKNSIGENLVQKNSIGKNNDIWVKQTFLDRITTIIPIN